ncbi:MAG: site-specific integrase [Lentimicrobium sp.]|jgi:integrase|nr:site-specific integrase [Lentimicrobium sp.]
MKTSIRYYIRPEYQTPDNRVPIYADLRVDSKRERFSLDMFVLQTAWDKLHEKVRKTDPLSFHLNKRIEAFNSRFWDIKNQCVIDGIRLTAFEFKQKLRNETTSNISLIDFFSKHVDKITGVLAPGTVKSYSSQLNRLKEFRKDVSFDSLSYQFLKDYEFWLVKEKDYGTNSIAKTMAILKVIIREAGRCKVFKGDDPFMYYKIKQVEGNRESLTIDELSQLEKLFLTNKLKKGHHNVLKAFLFECHTGLRYGDLKSLKMKHIKKFEGGTLYIDKEQNKTDKKLIVPLTAFAINLLPGKYFENQKVLAVYTNQYYNRELKKVMMIAGIKKHITTHSGRHTFAMQSLERNIPLHVTSSLMGHTKVGTTQIYAKTTLNTKIKEVLKWNDEQK